MNVRSRVVFSSSATFCKYFKVRICQHSTTQPEMTNSFVIVSRARSHAGNWPNKILGPIDSVNPKFPLPGAVAVYFASNEFKVPLTPAAVTIPKVAYERYASIMSEVQGMLENEVIPIAPVIPSLKTDLMEFRVHACPIILKRDLNPFFSGRDFSRTNLTVITVSRRTQPDASELLDRENFVDYFLEAAINICGSLKEMGYWADFIDPCTGEPFVGFHNSVGVSEDSKHNQPLPNLSLSIDAVGCCQVLRYPLASGGNDFFVGTVFTDAPKDHAILRHLES
uniref:Methylmalonic aciduria and homocystinuria type D homolog n=1 Tax=Schistocephalus solidus TaxID=70667 RepID=A0A0X3P210_SCHSO